MVHSSPRERVLKIFEEEYGSAPEYLVQAPGRVNLIGEHTDYNDGYVLPLAIDRAVWIALSVIPKPEVRLHSLDFDQSIRVPLDRALTKGEGWPEYLKGLINIYKHSNLELFGWKGVMAGNVPIGAGLSSSAALELALTRAFGTVGHWNWNPSQMASICQLAENEWVGMNCGIMDQMISASGWAGHVLLLDCRSLKTIPVPLPEAVRVVILDTDTRRGLVDSAYNERRSQCESVASYFGVKALRDVSIEQLERSKAKLDPLEFRRARHVIRENGRVLDCAEALRLGNLDRVGELMIASHISLRDDFEVSSEALDLIAECARKAPGCYGARMTGAGFGGCAVALVNTKSIDAFVEQLLKDYAQASNRKAHLYVCSPSDGASAFSAEEFLLF
ncbi:MAG: galactokinase [Candidatus Poseidoniia archaeon]|jgi:galactokinase|nr:galactokinase [Candidatus Poseidoniia archaeon]